MLYELESLTHHTTSAKPMKTFLTFLLTTQTLVLAGCGAIAEVAYDDAVYHERAQCEKLVSASERQSCLQRVNTAKRQADDMRKK
jgi:hypothetical protein